MLHLLPFVSDCLPAEEDWKAPVAGQRVIGSYWQGTTDLAYHRG